MFNVVHWSATSQAVEDAFRELMPDGWSYTSARLLSDRERREALSQADAVIIVNLDLLADEIAMLDRCKVVVHQGVGTDNVDVEALRRRGIPLDVTPTGTTDEVADYAILLMLAATRNLKAIVSDVDAGGWPTWDYRTTSRSLRGCRVGLIGFGRIGQAVASRLLAMKADVRVFPGTGRRLSEDWASRVRTADSVGALCDAVDLVSLHLPLRDDTVHLLDGPALDRLPRGALIVNTSRGQIIDEAELIARLKDGRLGGAALDVLVAEPPAPGHPLIGMPNVIVTPHLSSGTRDSLESKARSVIARISEALNATDLAV